jgi:hypothetical protein
MNTMFGLLVWARTGAGISKTAAAKAGRSAKRIVIISPIVSLTVSKPADYSYVGFTFV